jgi:sporulation protein YlmC with PRC-barrel domain
MQYSNVWLATTLLHDRVRNSAGEDLGKVEDIAIDPASGAIQYAILSFGGVLGMGDKLFPIPWSAIRMSPSGDHLLVDIDKETLRRAPSFERDVWPNLSDPTWRSRMDDHYGRRAHRVVDDRRVYDDRRDYVDRRPARRGVSVAGTILLICLVLALGWLTYLVSTRGWDQAKQDVKSTLQGAAYAAKETSQDAALTTKVKTALSLSKRIPSDKINVDSQNGVVTLRGEVPSAEVAKAAEDTVRDVPGVTDVHNHLFAPGATPPGTSQ